jgi:hypothetical protein
LPQRDAGERLLKQPAFETSHGRGREARPSHHNQPVIRPAAAVIEQ